jgi:lipoprotein-anchoring transpeptidase ErfK/SrfK
MLCLLRTFILGNLIFFLGNSLLLAQAESIQNVLNEAHKQAKAGQWDQSELLYFKALKSPRVEDRIRAYEGLVPLYTKLRLFKKAERTRKKLKAEEALKTRLVPKSSTYYKKYKVLKGDTYAKIAARYTISQEWLKRANRNKKLIQGKTILLPSVKYSIVVSKASKTMTWKRGEEVIKKYPVAVGRVNSQTPAGEFSVINKAVDPVWYRLGQVYPPESPDNLLGTRWLGLDRKGYGIHGTRDPQSIGFASSHGCVRMHNEDVEELFSWVPIGTKVVIR